MPAFSSKSLREKKIESISFDAFSQCQSLPYIDLSKCKSIGDQAFSCTPALKRVDFSSIERIGSLAFWESGLRDVEINNSCKILDKAFMESSVENVGIDNAEYIGDSVFRDCINLKTVNIRVGTLGEATFKDCYSLQKVDTTARVIEKACFCECRSLYKCLIPNAEIIKDIAFCGCTSLEDITQVLPTQEIGYEAFYNCVRMYNAPKMPSLTKIGKHAFLRSGVHELVVPKTVVEVGTGAGRLSESTHRYDWIIGQDTVNQSSFNLSWMDVNDHPNLHEMSLSTTAKHPPIDCVVKHDTVENLKQMFALKYVSTKSRLSGPKIKCIVSFMASLNRLREPMQCSLPNEMVMMILGMIANYQISTMYAL